MVQVARGGAGLAWVQSTSLTHDFRTRIQAVGATVLARQVAGGFSVLDIIGLRLLVLAIVLAVLLIPDMAQAQLARPGEPCKVLSPLAPPTWTEPERWAWEQICEGRQANFNTRYAKRLDPKMAKGWDDKRKLSPAFLETVLLHEPYRSAVTRIGVRIIGAWFRDPIDLKYARVVAVLWIVRSRLERPVNLARARFTRY